MICTRQHYTQKCYQRMRCLFHKVRRQKLAEKAANIWADLPPQTKGEILLVKWEGEQDDNDFDPATDRAAESDYCPRCGYICCECD